ncbi:MAG: porin [Flavobacteriales bacterium]|nr:MAG: porin [Flavobacteriales bacterium]
MKKFNLLLIGLGVTLFSFAQDTTNNTFGEGLYNVIARDNSYSMKFAIRMQSLYISKWNVNDSTGIGTGQGQFLIRRARLKFGGFAFSPKLKYKIELGLTNRDVSGASVHTKNAPRLILDAVIKWNFYKNFTLWAGQTKLPGNRERVVSSANLQLVNRSKLNSNFNIDRDMGGQLRHYFTLGKSFIVKEAFSVSQGEGRNVTDANLGGYQYTSRIEILPFGKFASKGDYVEGDIKREQKPKLALGGTYDVHNRAVKTKSNQGSYMENDAGYFETDVTTIFADMMFKYKGFSLMAEYALRTAAQDSAMNIDGTKTGDVVAVGKGMNFQMGYLFKKNWEVAGRYTAITLDKNVTGKELQTQYTFGISKYFKGHKLKVQSDISYLTENKSTDSELMYRLQFDLHF